MGTAVDTFNDYTRENWNDYYKRFQPIEQSVLNYNPEQEREKAFTDIDRQVGASFNTAQGALDRQREGLGIQADAAQRVSEGQQLGLARAIASVDAKNRANQGIKDNQRATQQFALDQDAFMTDVANNLMERSASLENAREIANGHADAQSTASNLNTVGKLAGTLYGIYDKYSGGSGGAGLSSLISRGDSGLSSVGSGAYANGALADAGFGDEITPFTPTQTRVGTGGTSQAGGLTTSGSLSDGLGMNDATGILGGVYSLGTKEGKFAGTASAAMSGYQLAGPWGALVGGILGYATEGGTKDMNPLDASGFSGISMDKAWQDQNLARLGSNPAAAVASKFGVKSDSVLGKILDPSAIFSKHGDEKRNMKAFTEAFPGITDAGGGKYALPDGATVTKDQLQKLAGTWYGATYHPDGDQAGWQKKFLDQLASIYGPLGTSAPTAVPTGPRYTDEDGGWDLPG